MISIIVFLIFLVDYVDYKEYNKEAHEVIKKDIEDLIIEMKEKIERMSK